MEKVEKIYSPSSDSVVWYLGHPANKDEGVLPRLICIVSGIYHGINGISNFWYWRDVKDDLTIDDKIQNGYGNFATAPEYSVEKTLRIIKNEKT